MRVSLEKKEDKERVRAALLRAALHLAAAHGFASIGLREVSREAGIAPTSFYRHFADMEELGATLIRELAGGVRRELAARVLAAPPAEATAALVEASFAFTARDAELARFIAAERTGAFPEFRRLLREEFKALAAALYAACSGETLAAGSAPPAPAEAAIVVLLDGWGRVLDDPAAGDAAGRDSLRACLQILLSAVCQGRGGHG